MPKISIVEKDEQTLNKNFGYKKDGVSLSFALRVDVKKELKAFLELMEEARKDIEAEITKLDIK